MWTENRPSESKSSNMLEGGEGDQSANQLLPELLWYRSGKLNGLKSLLAFQAKFTQDAEADLNTNLPANPLMLLTSRANTPIYNHVSGSLGGAFCVILAKVPTSPIFPCVSDPFKGIPVPILSGKYAGRINAQDKDGKTVFHHLVASLPTGTCLNIEPRKQQGRKSASRSRDQHLTICVT